MDTLVVIKNNGGEKMKVYVVRYGYYEENGVFIVLGTRGIFSSRDKALEYIERLTNLHIYESFIISEFEVDAPPIEFYKGDKK